MMDFMVYLITDKLPAMFVQYVLVTATVLLVLVFTLNRLLDRNSPATRYATWLLGISGTLAIPFMSWGADALGFESRVWNLPLLPAAAVFDTRVGASDAVPDGGIPVLHLFTWAWLAGSVFMLAGLVRSVVEIRRITRRAAARQGPHGAVLADAITAVTWESRRPLRVAVSHEVETPLAWGWRRPTILLPTSAVSWPAERSLAVLRHELAHIRRCDWIGAILLDVVRCLCWPNPLVWCAARSLRFEQELACDDAVLRGGTVPVDYARHLLDVAASATAPAIPRTGLAIARPSNLRSRVRRILDRRSDRRPASRFVVVAAFLFVATISPALAMLDPWHCAVTTAVAMPSTAVGTIAGPAAALTSAFRTVEVG